MPPSKPEGSNEEEKDWFCPKCKPVVEKRSQDQEEKRKKALAKEQAILEKRQ